MVYTVLPKVILFTLAWLIIPAAVFGQRTRFEPIFRRKKYTNINEIGSARPFVFRMFLELSFLEALFATNVAVVKCKVA